MGGRCTRPKGQEDQQSDPKANVFDWRLLQQSHPNAGVRQFRNFYCEICKEYKTYPDIFQSGRCEHLFCLVCIELHVRTELLKAIPDVKCPNETCTVRLAPENCRSFLSDQATLHRWNRVRWEYIRRAECNVCRRLSCIMCKAPWHGRRTCVQFREMERAAIENEGPTHLEMSRSKSTRCRTCKILMSGEDIGSHVNYRRKNWIKQNPHLQICGSYFTCEGAAASSSTIDVAPAQSYCEICTETKPDNMFFSNKVCSHIFCKSCTSRHVEAKLQRPNISRVPCPSLDCREALEVEDCKTFLPKAITDRWGDLLCESAIANCKRFHCPYKDCSAVILDDDSRVLVTKSECMNCRRLFCARCKVPWHVGLPCYKYEASMRGNKKNEDLILMQLAHQKKWKRCPSCKFIVEKKDGCRHITCRCRFHFCYVCGKKWDGSHRNCYG